MSAPKQSDLFQFAVDIQRAVAREVLLDPPLAMIWQVRGPDAAERAAILEEFYTEGRQRRDGANHDPKGET
jgi:hypothetical protein